VIRVLLVDDQAMVRAGFRMILEAETDITVVERDGAVEIAVTDDGRGFSDDEPSEGFGLIGMRERIRLAGGRYDVESSPGEGTTVHASIPATRAERSGDAGRSALQPG